MKQFIRKFLPHYRLEIHTLYHDTPVYIFSYSCQTVLATLAQTENVLHWVLYRRMPWSKVYRKIGDPCW
ncbi:MAG: hypothetical protein IJU19_00865 [Bacteroidales bacterium]|nr:hypothetical protein [Bacteroidales bacterium]